MAPQTESVPRETMLIPREPEPIALELEWILPEAPAIRLQLQWFFLDPHSILGEAESFLPKSRQHPPMF